MAVKPKITIEELRRILTESKGLTDSETAALLNKNYTTQRYGREFTSQNVQQARYALGVATEVGAEQLGAKKIEKVRKYLAKEIKKANDGDKFVSKQSIIKKAVTKFGIKTGAPSAKQAAGPRFRLDSKTYPILDTLESTEQKLDTVLKRMLMDDKPLGDLWYHTLSKKTGLSRDAISKSLQAGKVPTYNIIKDQGADLIRSNRLSTGQAKIILSGLSFSDQLTKADELLEGRPIISFGQDAGKTFQPKYTIMNFAFRNWDQNLGQGPIKFFDKKGKEIPWEFGKKLKAKDVSFSYNGKKYNLKNLSDTSVLKKDFAEVYKVTNEATAFKNRKIDNPFKPGSKIQVKDLIKKIQVEGYNWSPRYGTIDVLHGPKGVKGEPFTNLRFNTRDINTVEMTLNNSLRAGNITKSQFNESIKNLNEPFSGLKGKDYQQAIIDRAGTQATKIQKGTFYGFNDFLTDIRANAANNGPICELPMIKGKSNGGVALTCVDAVDDALEKNPKKLAQEINKSNAGGAFNKLKNSSTKFLTALKENPNILRGSLGSKIALGLGTVAAGAGAGALVKQFRNDDPSTYLTNDSQMEGMIISDVEQKGEEVDDNILLDNQFKLELAGAAGLTAPIAGQVYRTARRGDPPLMESPLEFDNEIKNLKRTIRQITHPGGKKAKRISEAGQEVIRNSKIRINYLQDAFEKAKIGKEGKGVFRSAFGLGEGVLGKGLWALGAPIIQLPATAGYIAQDIREGKDVGEIATNPLNYLGAAFMNPAVRALGKAGMSRGLLGIASLGLAGTAALPALSIGAGLATLGTLGYQGYKLFTGKDRSDEDFFK